MYIVCVTIFVKPASIEPFIVATLDNASNTRHEPNNIRFDVIQAEDDPSRFMLYEVYRGKEDFAVHQTTAHYLKWKNAVADLVAQPRTSTKNRPIFFGDGVEA